MMDCRRKAPSTAPPPGFTPLGNNIWFIEANPPSEGPIHNDKDPRLILIFGWMDAKLSHIAKFSTGYSALFPYADQIVVGSTNDILIYPNSLLVYRMQPLVDHLLALGVVGQKPKHVPVLVHTLSNGGCIRLTHLSELLAQSSIPTYQQPSMIIIDSAPSVDDISSGVEVFQSTIPSPILRYPLMALIFVIYSLTYLLGRTSWQVFEPRRIELLNPQLLPWFIGPNPTTRPTPWLFIYSKRDEIVSHDQVQAFVEKARSIGFKILQDVYEDSAHVSHMRSDPSRYWNAIRSIWKAHVAPS